MFWAPCCPAQLITPFTRLMLEWSVLVEEWHVTPMAMGLASEDLDPRFWPAQMVLKREQRRVEREDFEEERRRREQPTT